jgi:hypothetical protein
MSTERKLKRGDVHPAKTEAELRALCRFTNLQPLWAKENMSKGAKLIQIAA